MIYHRKPPKPRVYRRNGRWIADRNGAPRAWFYDALQWVANANRRGVTG